MSALAVGRTADDPGRRAQLAPPPRRAARPRSHRGTPPSSAAKPAGTSSRSPCQPQRKTPSTTVMTCSCGFDDGASRTYPSADRTSSGIIAAGEWRFGAGLEVEVEPGPGDHREGELGERETEVLGVARHGRRIDLHRGHRLGEPPRSTGPPVARSATSRMREPSSDRSTTHAVRKMLLAELDHAGDRSPCSRP